MPERRAMNLIDGDWPSVEIGESVFTPCAPTESLNVFGEGGWIPLDDEFTEPSPDEDIARGAFASFDSIDDLIADLHSAD